MFFVFIKGKYCVLTTRQNEEETIKRPQETKDLGKTEDPKKTKKMTSHSLKQTPPNNN
jgi:hypothetical protein